MKRFILVIICILLTSCVTDTNQSNTNNKTEMEVLETITTTTDLSVYSSPYSDDKLEEEIKANESIDIYQKLETDDTIWYQIGKDKWIKEDKIISFENMTHDDLLDLLDGKFFGLRRNYRTSHRMIIYKLERRGNNLFKSVCQQLPEGLYLNTIGDEIEYEPISSDNRFYKEGYICFLCFEESPPEFDWDESFALYFDRSSTIDNLKVAEIRCQIRIE